LLEEEKRKEMTDAYLSEHLWLLVGALYSMTGNKLNTPRYTEMIVPSLAKMDNRTADEIKKDIIKKLG
jgi:hypothetical protein